VVKLGVGQCAAWRATGRASFDLVAGEHGESDLAGPFKGALLDERAEARKGRAPGADRP
jgi:hypothetical protein